MGEVVIIGGGASGLVAAIYAAKKGNDVIIIEKNDTCGKKILATGNGRCNYWNEDQDLIHFKSEDPNIIEEIITDGNRKEILNFFYNIGIEPKIKNGYYYPLSNQAISVRDALLNEIQNLNIKIINNMVVNKIKKESQNFIIIGSGKEICAEKVILTSGSKASLKNENEAKGYQICKDLGLDIIDPLPALVQLKGKEKYFKDWNGIRSDVKVELYEDGIKIQEDVGEIQLTDYGISGICIFNLSSRAIIGLNQGKEEVVHINFLSNLSLQTSEDFINWMDERNRRILNRDIDQLLDGVLNKKLAKVLLKNANIKNNSKWTNLTKKEKEYLAENIITLKVKITGSNSFDKAQVCSGGIRLTEINPKTMETLKIKDLYIAGELLDVNGDCGGYNLEWAWITGMLAGNAIK